MKELIEKRIEELKNAIAQSVANNAGLNGRLLEAEWFITQMEEAQAEIASEEEAEEESEEGIAMHAGEQL